MPETNQTNSSTDSLSKFRTALTDAERVILSNEGIHAKHEISGLDTKVILRVGEYRMSNQGKERKLIPFLCIDFKLLTYLDKYGVHLFTDPKIPAKYKSVGSDLVQEAYSKMDKPENMPSNFISGITMRTATALDFYNRVLELAVDKYGKTK